MADLFIIWNRYNYTRGSNIYLVSEAEFNQFRSAVPPGLHVNELMAAAEQGSNVHLIATSDTPLNTFEVMEEVKAWMAKAGTESALGKVKSSTAFQGETMECCICRKKQQHVPGVESNWTLIQMDDDGYHVCPTCLQDSPYVKKTGNYKGQYERVLRRILAIKEKAKRGHYN